MHDDPAGRSLHAERVGRRHGVRLDGPALEPLRGDQRGGRLPGGPLARAPNRGRGLPGRPRVPSRRLLHRSPRRGRSGRQPRGPDRRRQPGAAARHPRAHAEGRAARRALPGDPVRLAERGAGGRWAAGDGLAHPGGFHPDRGRRGPAREPRGHARRPWHPSLPADGLRGRALLVRVRRHQGEGRAASRFRRQGGAPRDRPVAHGPGGAIQHRLHRRRRAALEQPARLSCSRSAARDR